MRLPLIAPADLSPEQRPVYDNMRAGIEQNFTGFKVIADNGSLMGPWNPWLHEPKFGKPIWDLTLALSVSPSLPRNAREVAILVTRTTFHSAYELYAHVIAAENRGLSDDKLATILAGGRPADLTPEEGVAYDVASALSARHPAGAQLPASRQAIWAARRCRIDLPGRPLLSCVDHAQWLQCARTAVRSGIGQRAQ
jgi:4-carboxymuconolactone decarboxylase